MKRLISECPVCHGKLRVASLKCPDCGLELRNEFETSLFDQLSSEQFSFLMCFLENRGSLKGVQDELQISYPLAKKKLEELLAALGMKNTEEQKQIPEEIDLSMMEIEQNSVKASEIVKAKLKEAGGRAIVYTARGLPCEVIANADGQSFTCDKLPIKPPYCYTVFDLIVDLLLENGGRARKGNGRNYKLGHPNCDETTVVGAIAYQYAGKKTGDSVFDPVFALAAILEWAGIATNERGELVLTAAYQDRLS